MKKENILSNNYETTTASKFALEKNKCKNCGSLKTYGFSRIVGYYSIIENWNPGKLGELKERQKGNYKVV